MSDENNNSFFDFISPTPIDKPNEDGERGTGYNYDNYSILQNYNIPSYNGNLEIESPFSYQVAGHDPFLRAVDGLLCKPVIPRELWFYLELDNYPHFKKYIPKFLGCVDFSTSKIREYAASSSKSKDITPWAEKVHQGHLQRINSPKHRNSCSIIPDLTFKFDFPCIMDLKIGQRSHGDDATDKKVKSQALKSKQTTSHSTGLRVCGCQGYSASNKQFWRLHKYEGRKITKETLPLAFKKFFHNEIMLRTDVIQKFLEEAKGILSVVQKQEFRFYSTSLLLVYDGSSDEPLINLKMIDFAHTFPAEGKPIDDGYLFGLENLISIFTNLLQEENETED